MNCYQCGQKMDHPYAIWHWQSGKPSKNYCWLCWSQYMRGVQKIAPQTVSFPRKDLSILERLWTTITGIAAVMFFATAHFLVTTIGFIVFNSFKKLTGVFKRATK